MSESHCTGPGPGCITSIDRSGRAFLCCRTKSAAAGEKLGGESTGAHSALTGRDQLEVWRLQWISDLGRVETFPRRKTPRIEAAVGGHGELIPVPQR
jgi:hypothetical protein